MPNAAPAQPAAGPDGRGRLLAQHTDPPCPEAATWRGQPVLAGHRKRLRGWLKALDLAVSNRLRGAAGCTHLNDAVRGLAAVPALAAALPPA